jgi:DNA-binding HxlR family transcriptional regulator
LSLLSVPLNVHVLRALGEEPLSLTDLRRAVGSPPQTTVRGHLKALAELGTITRRRDPEFPGPVGFELGPSGGDLLEVASVLERWLATAPDGALELGSIAARSTIKALVDGWSSTIVRALAARPLSLTDLNRLIADLNYPSLERRLSAMRLAGQIEASARRRRGTPYAVTRWLSLAVAPLTAAASWERQYAAAESAPIGRLDVEAAFLLAVPLVRLAEDVEGSCRLAVEVGGGPGTRAVAGVLVSVRGGRVVSCVARLQGETTAWASGTATGWIRAVLDHELDWLEIGGDGTLALGILEGLHDALARTRERT